MHSRATWIPILGTLLGVLAAACGSGSATPTSTATAALSTAPASATATSTAAATVEIAATQVGPVLVDAGGLTLYHFTKDTAGTIACTGDCATRWPPLVLSSGQGTPVAGEGLSGSLGTVKRPDGGVQVTYDGMPLYKYSGDTKPGDTTGQGIGGVWFVVQPAGAGPSATPTAPATATPTSSYYP